MTTTHDAIIANEPKYTGFEYIFTFTHQPEWAPTVRHTTTPDVAIRMARMVVKQYPNATWYIVRRSDGVCIAQSKQEGDNVQQEPAQADTALVLPGCVTNFMLRSKSSVQQDGTIVFTFEGKVKSRLDLHAFYVIADDRKWGKTDAMFKGSGEGYDWTLHQTFNKTGATGEVSFVMNDYSKKSSCDLEQRIARLVLRNQYATPAKVAKLIMAEIAR